MPQKTFLEPICTRTHLDDARNTIHEGLQSKGTDCPCCGQLCKVYTRKLNSNMARFLISLYMADGYNRWVHHSALTYTGRDYAYLAPWGLATTMRDATGRKRTAGQWRLTQRGRDFVLDELRVPSHGLFFNGKLWGWKDTTTSVRQALGDHFNYMELMMAVG